MKTAKNLSPLPSELCRCELEYCPICGRLLSNCDYRSGNKTVQTLNGVYGIAYQPKCCLNQSCEGFRQSLRSAEWLQIAPVGGTYGYDVIASIGWQKQEFHRTFKELHVNVCKQVAISESQVRFLYTHQYLPLLACHERTFFNQLLETSEKTGLYLSLDGLAPEGGEPQLWVVRELLTGLTLRSGWMSMQDQLAFENFLNPIAKSGLSVSVVLSDKQRGLLPAIKTVFPSARHALCQAHYLKNIAEPIATADEAMKVQLRKSVRSSIGPIIRSEHVEQPGVLTVTGLFPSALEPELSSGISEPASPKNQLESHQQTFDNLGKGEKKEDDEIIEKKNADSVEQQKDEIVKTLQQRIRYLLTLKGRPPFKLAGIEMYEGLTDVDACLKSMLNFSDDPCLAKLQQGIEQALSEMTGTYSDLRQAANWLNAVAVLLDPEGHSIRTGEQVCEELFEYLNAITEKNQGNSVLSGYACQIIKTTQNYTPGIFHSYDIENLPRTNNDRESEFRELMQHILRTTGQKGATRRIIQRSGAWEAIPHPSTIEQTTKAFSKTDAEDLKEERKRISNHRKRFKTHTRSAKQSQKLLDQLLEQWMQLAQQNGPV